MLQAQVPTWLPFLEGGKKMVLQIYHGRQQTDWGKFEWFLWNEMDNIWTRWGINGIRPTTGPKAPSFDK